MADVYKQSIDLKYRIIKSEIKRIRNTPVYKQVQKLIQYFDSINKQQVVYELNEYIENEFNLSRYQVMLQNLHRERVEWLKMFTGSKHIKNNEYYRNMAYKAIHEDCLGRDLLQLINDNYKNSLLSNDVFIT